jgi:hypothetical protein
MEDLQPGETLPGMLALTPSCYKELVFFIRLAAVMLASSIPNNTQTSIKLDSFKKKSLWVGTTRRVSLPLRRHREQGWPWPW